MYSKSTFRRKNAPHFFHLENAIFLFYLLKRSGQLNSEEEKEDAETARAE